MIVAWQFTDWNTQEKMSPSRRDGLTSFVQARPHLVYQDPRNRIIPSLSDGTLFLPFPGSKLPGYCRSVPKGRKHPILLG